VHNVGDVRQIEVHLAEPLVPGPSHLEAETAIAKLKKYKSPGSDQIPAELIQAGGEMLLFAIHKLINLWEPPMRASHKLPKAVSKQQLDKQDCRGDQLSY
jgi:hypothetical protein